MQNLLFKFQRAYSVNPFGERVGSESAPTLPRRGYQTGYPLPKKVPLEPNLYAEILIYF